MTAKIQGIFTPNVVPFKPDQSINEGVLREYTSWLIGKGVTGLYPNGSTGEFIRLSFEQRMRVVEIMADEARGRVPILAGAAEPNMDLVLAVAKRCADLGCRAVSVTGPYYFKVSQESIEHYFRELAKRSPIDIVLYNIPQFSNEISLEVVKRLAADCPRIVGIKDSSRDMPRFMDTLNEVKAIRPDFSCLIGCEEILLPVLMMGGDGGTIATSGVAPEAVMKLYDSFQAGDFAEAKRIQFKLLELIKTMFAAGNFPEGFREGVNLRGFDTGRGPQPMSPHEMAHFHAISSKLACLLAECGFAEAARSCERANPSVAAMLARLNRRIP
jgi:dihydrodipicolinate synthase/N-acetylneuraminate lyase